MHLRWMPLLSLALLAGCARPADSPITPAASVTPAELTQVAQPPRSVGEAQTLPPLPTAKDAPVVYPRADPLAVSLSAGSRYRVVIEQGEQVLMDWTQMVPGHYSQTTGRDVLARCEDRIKHTQAISQVDAELRLDQFNLRLDLDSANPTCATAQVAGTPQHLRLEAASPLTLRIGETQTWHSLPQAIPVTITLTRMN